MPNYSEDPPNLISFSISRFTFRHFSTHSYVLIAISSASFFPGPACLEPRLSHLCIPRNTGCSALLTERVLLKTVWKVLLPVNSKPMECCPLLVTIAQSPKHQIGDEAEWLIFSFWLEPSWKQTRQGEIIPSSFLILSTSKIVCLGR